MEVRTRDKDGLSDGPRSMKCDEYPGVIVNTAFKMVSADHNVSEYRTDR